MPARRPHGRNYSPPQNPMRLHKNSGKRRAGATPFIFIPALPGKKAQSRVKYARIARTTTIARARTWNYVKDPACSRAAGCARLYIYIFSRTSPAPHASASFCSDAALLQQSSEHVASERGIFVPAGVRITGRDATRVLLMFIECNGTRLFLAAPRAVLRAGIIVWREGEYGWALFLVRRIFFCDVFCNYITLVIWWTT